MDEKAILQRQWPYLLTFLPPESELERSAREFGAIRRKRRVGKASDLIRLALAYSFCRMPLRKTAAWAQLSEVAELSDVALLKRLRNSADWFGHLVGAKLAEKALSNAEPMENIRLRLVDATSISRPGSRGTDWRVHMGFDVARQAIDHIELTDVHGREKLSRFRFQPGELVVADRMYGIRKGLKHVLNAGSDFLVRIGWRTLPLMDEQGDRFDLLSWAATLPEAQIGQTQVVIPGDKSCPKFSARLIAIRKSESAAEKTRAKKMRSAARKGQQIDPKTLLASSYVFLVTSVSAEKASAQTLLETYRFRWQIEMIFKRIKSLLLIDELPAKDPRLARTFLYANLLAALLLDDFTERFLAFSPWGFDVLRAPSLPLENPLGAG